MTISDKNQDRTRTISDKNQDRTWTISNKTRTGPGQFQIKTGQDQDNFR